MFVKIVKTPKGDAPESHRKAWLGIIFDISPNDVLESGQGDEESIRGKTQIPRKRFKVDTREALRLLSLNSLESVGYFVSTWPETMYRKHIYFGWDEAEVMPDDEKTELENDRQYAQLTKIIIRDSPRK